MATPRYGYQPRRRRPRPRGWWLVLPLMLVVGAVALNSRLPDGGGALLTARTKCEGEGGETAVPSAHDIAVFGRELLRRPELAEIVGSLEYQPAWDRPAFSNSNRLLFDYPESIGIKIGFTDNAGQTIVAAAARGDRRIIVSVMGSSTVYQDAIALFEWAFSDTTSACRGLGGQGGQGG